MHHHSAVRNYKASRRGCQRRVPVSALRSGDAGRYADVIARSNEASTFADLVKFLLMVRKKVKDPQACPYPNLPYPTCPATLTLEASRPVTAAHGVSPARQSGSSCTELYVNRIPMLLIFN